MLLLEGPFQSDALLVPEGCLFDHIHNASRCWPFVRWNQTGAAACQERGMQMRSFAMLLPCGISLFSGVEFVCCPKHLKGKSRDSRIFINLILISLLWASTPAIRGLTNLSGKDLLNPFITSSNNRLIEYISSNSIHTCCEFPSSAVTLDAISTSRFYFIVESLSMSLLTLAAVSYRNRFYFS